MEEKGLNSRAGTDRSILCECEKVRRRDRWENQLDLWNMKEKKAKSEAPLERIKHFKEFHAAPAAGKTAAAGRADVWPVVYRSARQA